MDSRENIVAHGVIMPTNDPTTTIHGIPLRDNVRVTIDKTIKGSTYLPILVSNELVTVNDVIGSYVAWPKDLVVFFSDEVGILLSNFF